MHLTILSNTNTPQLYLQTFSLGEVHQVEHLLTHFAGVVAQPQRAAVPHADEFLRWVSRPLSIAQLDVGCPIAFRCVVDEGRRFTLTGVQS